ncbi:MAG: GrrA/OscA1 family cyclophane-containing rSAM-modified RiPP [Xenococcaceae cyanobacterium MO_188.B32]|nr:GrrA/OscA1 family cyclophane-containing rSAM-modified RiPP [Xenococcaceae cyanobacterium MO_188.B32]
MKLTKITWISFIVALATLNLPAKTKAHQADSISTTNPQMLESRLARIAATLKERETQISASSTLKKTLEIAGGWGKFPGGGFANGPGGGFLNRRRWGDGGGFFNRRY